MLRGFLSTPTTVWPNSQLWYFYMVQKVLYKILFTAFPASFLFSCHAALISGSCRMVYSSSFPVSSSHLVLSFNLIAERTIFVRKSMRLFSCCQYRKNRYYTGINTGQYRIPVLQKRSGIAFPIWLEFHYIQKFNGFNK